MQRSAESEEQLDPTLRESGRGRRTPGCYLEVLRRKEEGVIHSSIRYVSLEFV